MSVRLGMVFSGVLARTTDAGGARPARNEESVRLGGLYRGGWRGWEPRKWGAGRAVHGGEGARSGRGDALYRNSSASRHSSLPSKH